MLHRAFNFVDAAYRNQGSDFFLNGEANLMQRLVPAELRTVFDVGANAGHWSEAALRFWPNCHIHAFEIAPLTADRYRACLAKEIDRGRVSFNNFGMSDEVAEIEMFYYPGNDELTSHRRRHVQHPAERFIGKVSTLNHYCKVNNINQIDFLKIDIEGHEFKVIKGGSDLLGCQNISCIQFEYGAFSTESRFFVKDYYNLLGDYWIGKIFPDGVHFSEYDWTMEDFQFCNYVAVQKTRSDLKNLLSPR
jgi:FkbM family methyltransferase